MIASLIALGKMLRRAPLAPTSVASLLSNYEAEHEFRRMVRAILPDAEAEIMAARHDGGSQENARVWAFLRKVEGAFFPVYELEEYEQLVWGIPFVRNGWSYDRFHELDLPRGELLFFALCAQPYAPEFDTRISALDAASSIVGEDLLRQIPASGFPPTELHDRLDETSFAALADFADWLWGETGTAFLDLDDEVEISDAEWTREIVGELSEQWQRARAILDRIGTLTTWLEKDLPDHFARLLAAALGRDPHVNYLVARRLYACEITDDGLVPIVGTDEPNDVAVPVGAPSGGGR